MTVNLSTQTKRTGVSFSGTKLAIQLIFAFAVMIPFLPILGNGFVYWDDNTNFFENPDFRSSGWSKFTWPWVTVVLGVYQPFAWMVLELEYLVWGFDARGYHLVSLVLHALVSLVLMAFIKELLERVKGTANPTALRIAPMAAVLLWAVHPLRVEVVAWASCQPYLPCALLYIFALHAYLKAHPEEGPIQWAWLSVAWACAASALLFKAAALSLPLVLTVLDYYPLKRRGIWSGNRFGRDAFRLWLEKFPFYVLTLIFAVVAVVGREVVDHPPLSTVHAYTSKLIKLTYGITFYLSRTLNPGQLSVTYPEPPDLGLFRLSYAASLILVTLVTLGTLLLARRHPGLITAWAGYLALLAPHLLISLSDDRIVAERYSYLSTIPVFIGIAFFLSRAQVWKHRFLVLLLVLGFSMEYSRRTWHQCTLWGSTLALFQQAFQNTGPNDALILTNLGAAQLSLGQIEAAEATFRRILELGANTAEAYDNLGVIAQLQGRPQEASILFRKALEQKPLSFSTRLKLAEVDEKLGLLNEAEGELTEILRVEPNFVQARVRLAALLARLERRREAIQAYTQALKLDPEQANWHAALGTLLAREGELKKAVIHLRAAVQKQPNYLDARANLGMALNSLGRAQEAELEFSRVLRVDAHHPVATAGLNALRKRQIRRER